MQCPLHNDKSRRHCVHLLVGISRTKAFRRKSHAMLCSPGRQMFSIKLATAIFSQLTHPATCHAFPTYYDDRRKHRPGTRLQSKNCARFDRYPTRNRLHGALLRGLRQRSWNFSTRRSADGTASNAISTKNFLLYLSDLKECRISIGECNQILVFGG
jgi:hypothetical protein